MDSIIRTDIPARLDRLWWGRFHTQVILALGITWILDGLEVTLAGALSGALKSSRLLHLTDAQIGLAGSLYVLGAVGGALVFGWLADRWGRRRLFNITLGLYLLATALTAFSTGFTTFALFRLLTGAGIGGEYSAINSAIQELIPARYRGHTDLLVNGSFWIGAALGAAGAVILLKPGLLPQDFGWRVAFGIGAALGLMILLLRRLIPESPRWLMTHGQVEEGQRVVARIEAGVAPRADGGALAYTDLLDRRIRAAEVLYTLFRTYPRRTLYNLVLMASQAFFYNAIFFTYALVLARFYHVAEDRIGLYILPFAAGNFLGPLVLGRFFDVFGRKRMIFLTYALSGLLLAVTACLFASAQLSATGQTLAWCIVFFFASAAASSAYLTAGESFPLEMRALAIAIFYALGTGIGGVVGPWLLGALVGTGARGAVAMGYLLGAALMLMAAALTPRFGIAAERHPLEWVAAPLSSAAPERITAPPPGS
ncbi:MAG TPA: MFS transporter [Steroidobacteraceae bacterium]|nr:MFS transporter [Steroidobacteraceae bacterium]